MEAAQVSISRWMDKTTMGHLYNGIELGCKKEEKLILCESMDWPGEPYARWNKPVIERQILYDFSYAECNEQDEQTSKIETGSQSESGRTTAGVWFRGMNGDGEKYKKVLCKKKKKKISEVPALVWGDAWGRGPRQWPHYTELYWAVTSLPNDRPQQNLEPW